MWRPSRPLQPKSSSPHFGGDKPRPTSPSIENSVGRPLGRQSCRLSSQNHVGRPSRPLQPKPSSPHFGGCMPRPTSPSIDNHVGRPSGRCSLNLPVLISAGPNPALHHLKLKMMWGGPCGRQTERLRAFQPPAFLILKPNPNPAVTERASPSA